MNKDRNAHGQVRLQPRLRMPWLAVALLSWGPTASATLQYSYVCYDSRFANGWSAEEARAIA